MLLEPDDPFRFQYINELYRFSFFFFLHRFWFLLPSSTRPNLKSFQSGNTPTPSKQTIQIMKVIFIHREQLKPRRWAIQVVLVLFHRSFVYFYFLCPHLVLSQYSWSVWLLSREIKRQQVFTVLFLVILSFNFTHSFSDTSWHVFFSLPWLELLVILIFSFVNYTAFSDWHNSFHQTQLQSVHNSLLVANSAESKIFTCPISPLFLIISNFWNYFLYCPV